MSGSMKSRAQKRMGEDVFGSFVVTGGPCTYCHKPAYCVHYTGAVVIERPVLEAPNLILNIAGGEKEAYLGITCGCYSGFHRQVVHIRKALKAKEEK